MRGLSFLGSLVWCALLGLALVAGAAGPVRAHTVYQTKNSLEDKFRQLDEILPTPGETRTGSGAPGHRYWQQRADYKISVEIDDAKQRLTGAETITYRNNSPDTLHYLWVQLDQNRLRKGSLQNRSMSGSEELGSSQNPREDLLIRDRFPGGVDIITVKDAQNRALPHVVNDTMMRIDLPRPLVPGQTYSFSIQWAFNIHDHDALGGRSGYEFFEEDGNYIYLLAQWFPRMAAYTDVDGWNNKQFLGNGEFTLEFGDYDVSITVPADHLVAATGELQNGESVLTRTQRARLNRARTASEPVLIVTEGEAIRNGGSKARGTKTWRFKAENVRDFAFAASRKFIWDAQGLVPPGGTGTVMIMSFYPREANPLWGDYATKANLHAIKVYSDYLFPYPYPVSIAVNGPVGGMEYPMINFDAPRPRAGSSTGERSYSRGLLNALLSVIVHEVGHNWFPMIVNSDERQWTWMDEGLNSFVEKMALREWDRNFPVGPFDALGLSRYMASRNQVPVMTQSDSVVAFGYNAYAKPAVALKVLRDLVMGQELFDHAFRTYARRWMFKRPSPADFFRSMEDASAVDLDWFWSGWFYSTDHVDVSIDSMTTLSALMVRTGAASLNPEDVITLSPSGSATQLAVQKQDALRPIEAVSANADAQPGGAEYNEYFYRVEIFNIGGLITPLTFKADFEDGESQLFHLPAEIWKRSSQRVNKVLITDRPIQKLTFDPARLTGDVDLRNNVYPRAGASLTSMEDDVPNDLLQPELSDKLRSGWNDNGWSPHPGIRWMMLDEPEADHHLDGSAEH